uniref:uncharacterized protein LOC125409176 n=1 Tax=Myodes glareolus TaxID=447135 RepID=UPI0020208D5A|nr:uncharacterized protein LOC125409176 [Myodes glareolus]
MTQHPGARGARLALKQHGSLKDERESELLEKVNLDFGSTPLSHNSGNSDLRAFSFLSSPTALHSPPGLRCLRRMGACTSETGKTAKELAGSLFPKGDTAPLPAKLPPPMHLGSGHVFSVPTSHSRSLLVVVGNSTLLPLFSCSLVAIARVVSRDELHPNFILTIWEAQVSPGSLQRCLKLKTIKNQGSQIPVEYPCARPNLLEAASLGPCVCHWNLPLSLNSLRCLASDTLCCAGFGIIRTCTKGSH